MSDKVEKLGDASLDRILEDPFARESITSISVHYTRRSYGDKSWYGWGTVDFKRGNTSGQVEFRGDTFDEVAIQVKNFIENEL